MKLTIKNLIKLFLITLLFNHCVDARSPVSFEIDSVKIVNNSANFLLLGDWGRAGDFLQKETAAQMNIVAAKLSGTFVIAAGDNFYDNGVASIDDPLWWQSFENVYTGGSLLNEWFVVLGNHDYKGNTQAQIEYSKRSRRWRMPEYYYSIVKPIPKSNKKILFVFLDTNQFEKSYYTKPESYPDLQKQDPQKQLVWLDSVLVNSKADWKFIVGHHHVYTGGMRKNEVSDAGETLKPFLTKYKIDAYLCGHEHDLQYLKPEGSTHYFVSGAGSELRETGSIPITKFAKSVNGFMAFSVTDTAVLVQIIDYTGNVIYSTKIVK